MQMLKLWYEQPAKSWIEAMPLGNGRLGAMVFGQVGQERIALNEETLWSGYPRDLNPKKQGGSLPAGQGSGAGRGNTIRLRR